MFIFLSILTIGIFTLLAVSLHLNTKSKCKDETLFFMELFTCIIGILYVVWTLSTIEGQYRKYYVWKYNEEPEISYKRMLDNFIIRHIGKLVIGMFSSFILLAVLAIYAKVQYDAKNHGFHEKLQNVTKSTVILLIFAIISIVITFGYIRFIRKNLPRCSRKTDHVLRIEDI